MPVGAAIAGSAVVGAGATAYAANKGAKAQTAAANQANETQLGIFNQTRSDLSPYNTAGQSALSILQGGLTGGAQAGAADWQGYLSQHPELVDGPNGYNANKEAWAAAGIPDLQSYAMWHAQGPGAEQGYKMPTTQSPGNYFATGQGSMAGSLTAPIVTQAPVDYGALLQPLKLDQATLENLPGYKFALTQGLKSVQNSAAARGLGASGAALKGAAGFATGLADKTYLDQFNTELAQRNQLLTQGLNVQNQQFNQANTNRNTAIGALTGQATLGENAAAQSGTIGQNTGAALGQNITGAGNAQAAASVAGGNAAAQAAGTIGNYLYSNQLLKQLTANGGTAAPAARSLYGPVP